MKIEQLIVNRASQGWSERQLMNIAYCCMAYDRGEYAKWLLRFAGEEKKNKIF
jgi:hypothetical protein